MSCFSLARSSLGLVSRVGSCSSSSVVSARCLSLSSPDFKVGKQRMVAKVKGPPTANKTKGRRNRRRNTTYVFDASAIPEITGERTPLESFGLPMFPPAENDDWSNFTREGAIGKVYVQPRSIETGRWGSFLSKYEDNQISPMTVPRALSFDLMDRLEAIRTRPAEDKPAKHSNLILWGNSGSGKTTLLTQTHAFACRQGFITICIPSAIRHVSWNYPHHYSERTQTFHQPTLASFILDKLTQGPNNALLEQLSVDLPLKFTPDVAPGVGGSKKLSDLQFRGKNIADLSRFGAKEPSVSTEILEVVLERIRTQTQFPFMLSVDHAQAWFRKSKYITPELNTLESYHLAVPRMFLDIISGRKQIERGLTLLAPAPLDSIYRISPEMLHGMGFPTNQHLLGEYNMLSIKNYPSDPNHQLQLNHVENASDLEIVHVPEGLTLQEARGLWEAKSKRGMMHIVNSDDNFLAKYIEVQGNPREFFRAIDLSTS